MEEYILRLITCKIMMNAKVKSFWTYEGQQLKERFLRANTETIK